MRNASEKQLDAIEKRIHDIIVNRQGEKANYEKLISEHEQIKADAEKAETDAAETGDLEAYKLARRQKSDAESTISFYKSQITRIERTAAVTDDITQEISTALTSCQAKSNGELEKALMPVVEDLRKIVNEYRAINARIYDNTRSLYTEINRQTNYPDPKKSWLFNYFDRQVNLIDNAFKYRPAP